MTAGSAPMVLRAVPVTGSSVDWSAAVSLLVAPLHLSPPVAFASIPIPEVADPMPNDRDALVRATCTSCQAPVVMVRDIDTSELLFLDVEKVDQGHVTVFAVGHRAVCRRYGAPARRQPAWRVHSCPEQPGPRLVDDSDPYEDVPEALQQARWRQP